MRKKTQKKALVGGSDVGQVWNRDMWGSGIISGPEDTCSQDIVQSIKAISVFALLHGKMSLNYNKNE